MTDRQEPPTPKPSGLSWRECVCGAWYWGAPQTDSDRAHSRAARQEAADTSVPDMAAGITRCRHGAPLHACNESEAADTSGYHIDVLRLARAIEVHRTGKWYDPVYRSDFEEAEGLAAVYAELPDEHEERKR